MGIWRGLASHQQITTVERMIVNVLHRKYALKAASFRGSFLSFTPSFSLGAAVIRLSATVSTVSGFDLAC